MLADYLLFFEEFPCRQSGAIKDVTTDQINAPISVVSVKGACGAV